MKMPPKLETKAETIDKKTEKKAKAAEKKETKRLEVEERAQFLKKEHLRREIELGARNAKRFQRSWREMVMKMKMPGVKEDIEVAWRTLDRVLDIKDYSISLLLDAIDKSEEQYQMNVRSQSENIDQFITIYKMRLAHEEENYQQNVDELLNEAENETDKIKYQQSEDEIFLQAMIFAMKQRLEKSLNNVQSKVFTKIESHVDDFKNLRRLEASFLTKNMKTLWKELQNIVSDYMKNTKDRRRAYDALKEKDDNDRNIIDRQIIRTAMLFEEIRKFKEKIANFKSTTEKQVTAIMKERNFFQQAYWTAKNRFLEEQTIDRNQFRIMAVEYNRATEHLNQLVKKLENILTLIQICRKLETQDEKVIPFSIPTEIEETKKVSTSSKWKQTSEIIKEVQYLDNFWRRTGAAQIIMTEIKQEREILKKETMFLRECLKYYMTEGIFEEIPKTLDFDRQ